MNLLFEYFFLVIFFFLMFFLVIFFLSNSYCILLFWVLSWLYFWVLFKWFFFEYFFWVTSFFGVLFLSDFIFLVLFLVIFWNTQNLYAACTWCKIRKYYVNIMVISSSTILKEEKKLFALTIIYMSYKVLLRFEFF